MNNKNASGIIGVAAIVGLSMLLATGRLWAQPLVASLSSASSRTTILAGAQTPRRLLLTHYMPWYEANAAKNEWGWHWTMNHYQPGTVVNGKRPIASHYYPLIGPYDSSDPDVIEYHLLLMKLAGIDGPIIDWYGTDNYLDFGLNNRNAESLVGKVKKAQMRFAAVYEDGSTDNLVKGGKIQANQTIAHGQATLTWLQNNWFSLPSYVTYNGRPVFLTFGVPGYYKTDDWNQIFSVLPKQPAYFTETSPRPPAVGAFVWPSPFGGTAKSVQEDSAFYSNTQKWTSFIAGAYPRFDDCYKDAGVGPSWGHIDDLDGKTYEQTLTRALTSKAPIIQIATWNDWGEGTMIEPSQEMGYRDLETTQRLVRKYIKPSLSLTPGDLRLPMELYKLRKDTSLSALQRSKLDSISDLLFNGKITMARRMLTKLKG
jgi:hypothetical protein